MKMSPSKVGILGRRDPTKKEIKMELIKPEKVIVHYKCMACGAKETMPLDNVTTSAFVCDKCNNLENFLEIEGVEISKAPGPQDVPRHPRDNPVA